MDLLDIVRALVGGLLIGGAAALLLVVNGRIAGISSIAGDLVSPAGRERGWKALFVAGLIVAGAFAALLAPSAFGVGPTLPLAIVGGVLVGVGTRLSSGCTSGHGVCGIGRFSIRSIVATLTFMGTGALTVVIARALGVTS